MGKKASTKTNEMPKLRAVFRAGNGDILKPNEVYILQPQIVDSVMRTLQRAQRRIAYEKRVAEREAQKQNNDKEVQDDVKL